MKIAIVTGHHDFKEAEFDAVFGSMEGIEFVREELDVFVNDPDRNKYEVVVFYNFHQQNPDPETSEAILSLADEGQGLVILHHAILAFPQWKDFSDICGIQDRKFSFSVGEKLHMHVADNDHPITAGITDWDMTDETYLMKSPGQDSHTLLTTDNPTSIGIIAWTRTYRNSRVFCFQSGHDDETYTVPQFQEVLARGISWAAGQ